MKVQELKATKLCYNNMQMDTEKRKKRQSLKIIISEAIMVLAVIITVTILGFIVSGYWINSDFEIERQGMLQISSTPTGASVDIDGDAPWLQRTNTSKVLSSGEHTITLTKDGYDSWSKTVGIKEGLLYRINYPRLFLQNRSTEKALSITGTTFATISPDRNSLVLANNTTKWSYVNLDTDKSSPKPLEVSSYFSSVSLAEGANTGLFTGIIASADWDHDGSHALFQVKNGESTEWVLLDVKNPDKSINLTKEFGGNFTKVSIIDNSSTHLLAVQNGNLHKIDVPSRSISAILVENVISFDHFEQEIVFTAKTSAKQASTNDQPYYIGYLKNSDSEITELEFLSSPAKVALSQFYDNKYITTISGGAVSVHPEDDFDIHTDYQLTFSPDHFKVGENGEYIIMYTGTQLASLDMEGSLVREWPVEGGSFGWIDNNMIYTVVDGELIIYDFDGYNRRVLAKNVSAHFPAGITSNKWLYYASDDYLMREWLVEH